MNSPGSAGRAPRATRASATRSARRGHHAGRTPQSLRRCSCQARAATPPCPGRVPRHRVSNRRNGAAAAAASCRTAAPAGRGWPVRTAASPRWRPARPPRSTAKMVSASMPALCHARPQGAQRHGRAGKPAAPRDLALSAAARRQPRALAPLGAGGAGRGASGKQADPALDRLRRLPLVPRHGARILRGPGDRGADERAVRQHQGRPRGTAGHRPALHVGAARAGRAGRLAADHVHHAGRRAVLGRHLFPARAALGPAVVPPGAARAWPTPIAPATRWSRRTPTRCASVLARHVDRQSGRSADAGAPRCGGRGAAADERPGARRPARRAEIPQPADLPLPLAERIPHRCDAGQERCI